MNLLNYFHYPFVILAVLVGLASSWSDIRESKIKNRLIVFGALAALLFYLAEILALLSFDILPRWGYFRDVLVNVGFGFLAGFILWRFNVWAPGDAKLFALFAFLIPLVYYEKNYLPYFPSFALMLNIFIVVLVFIFLKMLFDFFISAALFFFGKRSFESSEPSEKTEKENPPEPREPSQPLFKKILKEFLLMPVFIFGIFIALSMVFKSFQAWGALGDLEFLDQPVFLFLSLFMFFQAVNKMSRSAKAGLAFSFLSCVAIGLLFWPEVIAGAFFKVFQLQALYFIFGFLILNKLIDFYIEKRDILRIPSGKLKPGMIVGQKSLEKLREARPGLEIDSDGLTEEDLAVIKDIGEKNPQLRFVEICKTMPLAPFIFLGVILTLILKGALIAIII